MNAPVSSPQFIHGVPHPPHDQLLLVLLRREHLSIKVTAFISITIILTLGSGSYLNPIFTILQKKQALAIKGALTNKII